jgi:hypothetical protein
MQNKYIGLLLLFILGQNNLMAASADLDVVFDTDKAIDRMVASIPEDEGKTNAAYREHLFKHMHEVFAKVDPAEHKAIFEQANRMLEGQPAEMQGNILEALCRRSALERAIFEPYAMRLINALAPNYDRTTALLALPIATPEAYDVIVTQSLRLLRPAMHDWTFFQILRLIAESKDPKKLVDETLSCEIDGSFNDSDLYGQAFLMAEEVFKRQEKIKESDLTLQAFYRLLLEARNRQDLA